MPYPLSPPSNSNDNAFIYDGKENNWLTRMLKEQSSDSPNKYGKSGIVYQTPLIRLEFLTIYPRLLLHRNNRLWHKGY